MERDHGRARKFELATGLERNAARGAEIAQADRIFAIEEGMPAGLGFDAIEVMASEGYPGTYEKGHVITGLDEAAVLPGITIFHAGTARQDGKITAVGGRVLDITATGRDVSEAQGRAYAAVAKIHWDGAFSRSDICWRALTR